MIAARAIVAAKLVADDRSESHRKRIPVAPESPARRRTVTGARLRNVAICAAIVAAFIVPAIAN